MTYNVHIGRDNVDINVGTQGRRVPYARTQVLPHRFDNLKLNFFFLDFIREISIMNL